MSNNMKIGFRHFALVQITYIWGAPCDRFEVVDAYLDEIWGEPVDKLGVPLNKVVGRFSHEVIVVKGVDEVVNLSNTLYDTLGEKISNNGIMLLLGASKIQELANVMEGGG